MNTIICISRQFASGGYEVGKQIAEAYDVPFYDSEIITESVKRTGLDEGLIRNSDETASNSLIYSIAMSSYMNMGTRYIEAPGDKVFKIQEAIIQDYANNGPCIIVGRCAGEILRDNPNCRRIFIYADKDLRIKRAMASHGYSLKKTEELLQLKDRERRAYHTRFTNCKWGSLDSFDLAINTSRCGITGAVKTVTAYIENLET